MTTYTKTWRNNVWLVWFTIQVPIILLIDALEFYPKWLHESPGAPLHLFATVQKEHIAKYNDPIVQWSRETASGHDSWMGLFLYLEFAFTLPTVLYALYRFGVKRTGTSGADELLFLLYGFETALTTLVCIHDSFYWDDAVYSAEVKRTFQVNFFGPWFVIPTLVFIDMASRILSRIRVADAALAGKKVQ
ncbi:transmembrane protein 6/97 [Apodospora peruviana]|uniref:Efficient mitochondria targeting-associated protein 19 n=1 Tax=Apodospora peruviana TaxID=516989 RepID=A0AAE0M5H8_9PEZI|nr:transmembrane protein 6/97 [Apodospora peruviana]